MRILILLLSFFSFFFLPQLTYAHVLKIDGDIGAVLHINPDDDPVVGEVSNFYLEFKDKKGLFSSEKCNCTVAVLEEGSEIYSQPLFQREPNKTGTTFSFTFPQKDVYTIQVTGSPIEKNDFQSFALRYDVRVDRVSGEISKSAKNLDFLPYIIGGALGIIIVIIVVNRKSLKR